MINRVLLVDDETHVLMSLKRSLHGEPLEIVTATSAESALGIMKEHEIKVVVSDEQVAGMQGSDFLRKVREKYPQTQRIALAGDVSPKVVMKAVNEGGVYRFFTKPWDTAQIILAIRSAIEKYDLEEKNKSLLATIKYSTMERWG